MPRRLTMGAGGRLVIPADLRERLHLEPGSTVVLTETADGELTIRSTAAGLRRARALLRERVSPGERLADELIADRRAEAARGERG